MKLKIFFILICNLIICNLQFSQNITNTLGTGGLFTIKSGATTFFSLTQSTGNIVMLRSLGIGNTTNLDTNAGVIRKNGLRFIHDFSRSTSNNTFMGINSGNMTMLVTASSNTGMGHSSLFSLTSGTQNSAFGVNALYSNTTGVYNCSFGNGTMYKNTSGNYNSAFGTGALGSSILDNMTGSNNCAIGTNSCRYLLTGSNNTAIGMSSGNFISTGSNNTTIGYYAGGPVFDIYNNCVAIGSNTQLSGNNSIIIGADIISPGANTIQIGNSLITAAYTQVAWTITSDRKFKSNIVNSPLGLDFITKLRPVSYTRVNDESGKNEYGFIAQEVEEVLKKAGDENNGMIRVDEEGTYNMRYNDLFAPMVRSIQELKEENDSKSEEIAKLKQELAELKLLQAKIFEAINNKEIKLSENK